MTTTPSAGPNIMDPTLIASPRGGFDRIRVEEAPAVLGQSADGTPASYVTRYDDVRAVLGDPRFVNGPRSAPGREAVDDRDQMLEMLGVRLPAADHGDLRAGGCIGGRPAAWRKAGAASRR
jgi:cytochrome P450